MMKNFSFGFLTLLISFFSCNKKEPNEKDLIGLYSGYGVVVELASGCQTEIKMYKGYENVLRIYSVPGSVLWFKPSIISTKDDTINKRQFTENEILKGDSIYFEFREDYENLGGCLVGNGMTFYPPKVFVTKVKILK